MTTGNPDLQASAGAIRLINATLASIHAHGLCATTVDTICQHSGLSRGMIRHCFSSKENLIVATYRYLGDIWKWEGLARRQRFKRGDRDELYALVEDMFSTQNFDPVRISSWFALSIAAASDAGLRAVNHAIYAEIRTNASEIFAAVAKAEGRKIDSWNQACVLTALADGLWLQHLLDNASITTEMAIDVCRRFIDGSLAATNAGARFAG